MSRDHFDIVDCDATLAEAAGLADKVIDWMLGVGIVAMPATDAPNGQSYPKGARLGEWAEPATSASNIQRQAEGVEVEIGRKVHFDMSGAFPDSICPRGHRQPMGPDDFEAVEEWYSATGPAQQACTTCQASYLVTDWSFEPDFALGNLAFTFWSVPPMSPRLVAEVARLLAPHRVVAVSGRI